MPGARVEKSAETRDGSGKYRPEQAVEKELREGHPSALSFSNRQNLLSSSSADGDQQPVKVAARRVRGFSDLRQSAEIAFENGICLEAIL